MPEIDQIEKSKRIRSVQEWLIDDYSYMDIVKQIILKWSVSDRTAARYIKEARQGFSVGASETIEIKRQRKIESLKKLKRSLKSEYAGTPAGIDSILKIERQIILLEGLEPPKRMALMNPDGTPLLPPVNIGEVNINMLTSEALHQLWAARIVQNEEEPDGNNTDDPEPED